MISPDKRESSAPIIMIESAPLAGPNELNPKEEYEHY